MKSTWRPSVAEPSPSSTPPREQPLKLVLTGRTDRGVEPGPSRSKPAEETVVCESLPIVHYIPPETRPTLEDVRHEIRQRPFEPSRALAEFLGLNYRTPISLEQKMSLPEDVRKFVSGTEHLTLVTEVRDVWYGPPISKAKKQPDGTRSHVRSCQVFRDLIENDPRLPPWVTDGIGPSEKDTKKQHRIKRQCMAMMRNVSHATTQLFLRRLGHSTMKLPPVGGSWKEYDRLRKEVIPTALTPEPNNLKTIATTLGVWRDKTKSSIPGEPGVWGEPSAPGVVNKMRVTFGGGYFV